MREQSIDPGSASAVLPVRRSRAVRAILVGTVAFLLALTGFFVPPSYAAILALLAVTLAMVVWSARGGLAAGAWVLAIFFVDVQTGSLVSQLPPFGIEFAVAGAAVGIGLLIDRDRARAAELQRQLAAVNAVRDKLSQSEESYRALVEATRDLVFTLTSDGSITSVSAAFDRQLGLVPSDWIGRSVFDLVHPDDLERCSSALRSSPNSVSLPPIQARIRSATGEFRDFEITATVQGADGPDLSLLGVARDVTKRVQAEAALVASEERFRSIFEQSSLGIGLFDVDGVLIEANQAGGTMFGRSSPPAANGYRVFDDAAAPPDARERLLRGEAVQFAVAFDFDSLRASGSISTTRTGIANLEFTLSAIRDETGDCHGFVGQVREVTDHGDTQAEPRKSNAHLFSWVQALERHGQELAVLSEMSDMFQTCVSVEEAYEIGARTTQLLFPLESGAMFLLDEARETATAVARWGASPPDPAPFQAVDCWAIRERRLHLADPTLPTSACRHSAEGGACGSCVPLLAQGVAIGVISLSSPVESSDETAGAKPAQSLLAESRQRLAVTVAEHIALAISNLVLRETLRGQAVRDPLTGLFNRRYMEETLDRELRREVRRDSPLGIVMIDVDLFKGYNDEYGHDTGDTILQLLGEYLQTHVRGEDVACRLGGDEFILILPDTPLDAVVPRAEELREGIRGLRIPYGEQALGTIKVSLGIAVFPAHGRDRASLIKAADSALYRAKATGRDRIAIAPPLA